MTTVVLTLDKDTKRFDLDDGPTHVHAGETVELVLRGVGINAEKANGVYVMDGATADEPGTDLASAYPYLRARLVHPVYGDLAMYPWPASPPNWRDTTDGALKCQLDLDTEQLFRVVRHGFGDGLVLYVETPWPETYPTVYGTYGLRVDDWPEATGESRTFPSSGRYANAFGKFAGIQTLDRTTATLREVVDLANEMLGAMKVLAGRNGEG